MRWRQERQQARVVADYADALIVSRRGPEDDQGRDRSERQSIDETLELVRVLSAMEIAAPRGAEQDVWRRLQLGDPEASPAPTGFQRPGLLRERLAWFSRGPRFSAGVLTLIVVACIAAIPFYQGAGRRVLAGEVLGASDSALLQLLGSGRVLHRVWRTETLVGPSGREQVTFATVHEWMQEHQTSRLARRAYDGSDHLLWAMVTQPEDGEPRAQFYYPPGYKGRADGLLRVSPTAAEYRDAVDRLPANLRPALQMFFRPGFGSGIVGERSFNQSNLGWLGATAPVRRAPSSPVSLVQRPDGQRVYQVHLEEPLRMWVDSTRDGALTVSLGRGTTIREISREDRLTVSVSTDVWLEDGNHVRVTWDAIGLSVEEASTSTPDPFSLDVPPGTRVQDQAPYDELVAMAPTLTRYLTLMTATNAPQIER